MDKGLENRLTTIEKELRQFANVIKTLGRDLGRPVEAVRDGYYEAALTNAGSIVEAMKPCLAQNSGNGKMVQGGRYAETNEIF